MNEKLKELREKRLIEIGVGAGLSPTPGVNGIIVTTDKKQYYYHSYRIMNPDYNRIPEKYLSGAIDIDDNTYNELINIIENDILDSKHKYQMIMDIDFFIEGSYNNKNFKLENETELYRKIHKLLGGKYE